VHQLCSGVCKVYVWVRGCKWPKVLGWAIDKVAPAAQPAGGDHVRDYVWLPHAGSKLHGWSTSCR
jgi:hypothetical protein